MKYLGGNIYLWDKAAQNRLLIEFLGPAYRELCEELNIRKFWFDRFDARGPHIFFFFSVPAERFEEIRERMADRLQAFLDERPSRIELSSDELTLLHRQMRGKALCPADEGAELAQDNSFLLFEHSPTGYPLYLTAHLENADEYWRLFGDLSFWAIQQVEARPEKGAVAAGVRWAAALDEILRQAGIAREYWQYHATTLIIGLDTRLATAERQVFESIREAVGAKNRKTFTCVWSEVERSGSPWPHLPQLVEVSLSGDSPTRRFAALREAAHCTWKQLGLPTREHIPLVLFAWNRNLLS
jgi:hypothetical protein